MGVSAGCMRGAEPSRFDREPTVATLCEWAPFLSHGRLNGVLVRVAVAEATGWLVCGPGGL